MAKEMIILGVSVITLFVAGFVAYAVYDLDRPLPQSAIAETKDYTTEFETIRSAINQVNTKLEKLETDTMKELDVIKGELEEVKSVNSPQELIDTSTPFSISLNKATYSKQDTITVFAHNILPQKAMTIQLLSSFNELITTITARSDSMGKLNHAFKIPSFVPPGDYKIKAITSDGKVDIKFFTISDDETTSTQTSEESVAGLSVALDKSSYNPGDMIKVTGFAQASTSITAELISPDHEVATAYSTASSDSNYVLIFILSNDAEPGNWKLKVMQGEQEETLTFTVKN